MKRKISGLVSFGIILVAVGAAYFYYDYGFWKNSEPVQVRPIQPLAAIWVPDQSTIKEIKRLERDLGQLVQPPEADTNAVDLMLFGYHSTDTPTGRSGRQAKTLPIDMDYDLSFTFVSSQQRLCMINRVFYSQGAELPDGARILKIEPKRVLIQKKRYEKWIDTKDLKGKTAKEPLKNKPKNNPS